MIEQSFIDSCGTKLFCSVSQPDTNTKSIGVLIAQPFTEECILMHRALYNLNRELNHAGLPVCRFDLYGQGDSEGDFKDANLNTWKVNLIDAYNYFKRKLRLTEVVFCGFRFGATLTMSVANEFESEDKFILVDPIIKGQQYIDNVLRTNLSYQMVTYGKVNVTRETLIKQLNDGEYVNIDGYLLNGEMYNQIGNLNLQDITHNNINVLVLNYSKNLSSYPGSLKRYCDYLRSQNCNVKSQTLPDPTSWKASELYCMQLTNTSHEICEWLNTF